MTDERCRYLVCREPASAFPPRVPVQLCAGHQIIAERWVARGATPHVSPDGALYVGDLDELLTRPSRP